MRPSAHLLPARCSKRRSSRFHGETHNAKARLCCRLNSGDVGHWLYPGHHLRSAWLGPATRAPLPDRHGLGYTVSDIMQGTLTSIPLPPMIALAVFIILARSRRWWGTLAV